MKKLVTAIMAIAVMAGLVIGVQAADIPSEVTLFKNVNIFDGKSDKLMKGYDVLVVRNLIKKVAKNIPTSFLSTATRLKILGY